MLGKKLESSKPVPIFEVKEMLKEREADGELTYEQTLANDYVKKFSKLTKAKGIKLIEELTPLVEDQELAVKIADIMPAELERLKLLIPKGMKVEEAKLKEIFELVLKYAK